MAQNGVDYCIFHLYDPFSISYENMILTDQFSWNNQISTLFFAQVRMVMKYRNQLDNGDVSTRSFLQAVSGTATPALQQATDKRQVRIVLE